MADLGVVDDRRRRQAAHAAEARDGERRAGQLVARDRMVAGRFGDPPHLAGGLPQVHRLGMPHDRHAQPAIGLRGHAQVHRLVTA